MNNEAIMPLNAAAGQVCEGVKVGMVCLSHALFPFLTQLFCQFSWVQQHECLQEEHFQRRTAATVHLLPSFAAETVYGL